MIAQECREAGLNDLANSIGSIEQYVNEWWSDHHLNWFTDHGLDHSQRVAEYAFQISDIPNLPEEYRLSTLERYVLWASAFLHDLGMQVITETPLGELATDDYTRIRHEHPDQSALEIMQHGDEMGLPKGDLALRQIVAYVARAHGTEYYEKSLPFLNRFQSARNQRVRGPLLAAILLMADELDLHYERAKVVRGRAVLNTISEAHAMKHRSVLRCGVQHRTGRTGRLVAFEIQTQRFLDFPLEAAEQIETWIIEKIRRQISMVENEFSQGFAGYAALSRVISLTRVEGVMAAPPISMDSLNVIRSENARARLIDHDLLFAELCTAVDERGVILLTVEMDALVDLHGREDLLDALAERTSGRGNTPLASWCLYESAGTATAVDVVREWESQLSYRVPAYARAGDGLDRDEILDSLTKFISASGQTTLVTLSSIDQLSRDELVWMCDNAVTRLRGAGDVSFVATASKDLGARTLDEALKLRCDELDRDQVRKHLLRYAPALTAGAEARASLGYSAYKRLRDEHLIALVEEQLA